MNNKISFFELDRVGQGTHSKTDVEQRQRTIHGHREKIQELEVELEKLRSHYGCRILTEDELQQYFAFREQLLEIAKQEVKIFEPYDRYNIQAERNNNPFPRSVEFVIPKVTELEKWVKIWLDSDRQKDTDRTFMRVKDSGLFNGHETGLSATFSKNLLNRVADIPDLDTIMEIRSQYPLAIESRLAKIAEYEEFIRKHEGEERISTVDIDRLNAEIARMNEEGWVVKQIEGIQSGAHRTREKNGYGYGFTQGVLVLWERINR